MHDKRSHERLIVIGDVTLKDESNNSIIAEGFLDNISYSGALIFLRKEIEQGKDVLVEFKMSFLTMPICIKGRIKYIKQSLKYKYPVFKAGLEFSESDKGKVEYIIKRIHAVMAEKKRNQENIEPPDFIAY
ncbi:MAG: PilZ domain-containing protein [Candidatus Omnitrophota bacterium]